MKVSLPRISWTVSDERVVARYDAAMQPLVQELMAEKPV